MTIIATSRTTLALVLALDKLHISPSLLNILMSPDDNYLHLVP